MNPNAPVPANYLDQIAAPQIKKPRLQFNLKTIILLGLALLIVVGGISAVGGALTESRKKPWEQLSARLDSTAEIIDSSSGLIKNSQLRSTNSSLKLYLANATRDIATPLQSLKIDAKKIPKEVTAAESTTEILATLDDARLNAVYDSTYAREMSYQLSKLLTLLQQLYASSSKESTKTFLETTYTNLQPLQKTLASFSASNE